jgi:uncharacterized protein YggE
VKFASWQETRPQRLILTGDGSVTVEQGEVVIVAVVQRWDDAASAMAAIAKLVKVDPEPDGTP